jgi:hypothetical protein
MGKDVIMKKDLELKDTDIKDKDLLISLGMLMIKESLKYEYRRRWHILAHFRRH